LYLLFSTEPKIGILTFFNISSGDLNVWSSMSKNKASAIPIKPLAKSAIISIIIFDLPTGNPSDVACSIILTLAVPIASKSGSFSPERV